MGKKMDFNDILKIAVQKLASDVFITSGMPPTIKVDGKLMPVSKTRLTANQSKDIVLSIMTPEKREEFHHTKECNFAHALKGVGRFRVSAFVQRDEIGMVMRRIETKIPTVEGLDLPPVIKDLAMTKRGIVLFVGATGTGKSTSLASMVGYRNGHGSGHIISIEDPIEFTHEHQGCIITQREVGVDTESFEVALKNTLRQAPDVILIGEIRTREVMENAITFAETGHLVLATLHANNSNQAMERVLHFFPEERHHQVLLDLSLNMKGIIAQQLIPKPSGKGRKAILEVLLNSPLAADLIQKGEVYKLKDLMKRSREEGMITFDDALYEAYTAGDITMEDALRYADSANEVRLLIKLGGKRPGMPSDQATGEGADVSVSGVGLVDEEDEDMGRMLR